ncbi:MAG: hypothetical protein JWQ13_1565 [Ramlibacter sp.]|nr:hypothetical protein [Ramlibacter sp.]
MNRFSKMCASCGVAMVLAGVALLAGCGGGSPAGPAPQPTLAITVAPPKVAAGEAAVLTWSSPGSSECAASGAWSGPQAPSGALTLSAGSPGRQSFSIRCSGSGGSVAGTAVLSVLAAPAAPGTNVMQVVVDRGPVGTSFNMPFVSVTVCVPGQATCRTVDRVLVDTGSVGLRLMAATLDITPMLPAVATETGAAAGACGQFVSGFSWGSLRRADVQLGGAVAAAIPIQLVSDPSAPYAAIPTACSNIGFNQGTAIALGANGILGVGLFLHDCAERCVASTVQRTYYGCDAAGCVVSALPLESQLSNPVASLAGHDNGLSITLPPVPAGGASAVVGTLTFGLGTAPNNQLAGATIHPTDRLGYFTTVYKGRAYSRSFIDSGSNGIFFDDPDLPVCGDFYCPRESLLLTASTGAATVSFTIDNIALLTAGTSALHAAGPYGLSQNFDWGLPFFFGRTVALALSGAATPSGSGPYWAY